MEEVKVVWLIYCPWVSYLLAIAGQESLKSECTDDSGERESQQSRIGLMLTAKIAYRKAIQAHHPWKPTGRIACVRRNGSVGDLRWFRFPIHRLIVRNSADQAARQQSSFKQPPALRTLSRLVPRRCSMAASVIDKPGLSARQGKASVSGSTAALLFAWVARLNKFFAVEIYLPDLFG